jgi:hypothetical protein
MLRRRTRARKLRAPVRVPLKSCLPSPSTHRKVARDALRRAVTRFFAAARALARRARAAFSRARRSRRRFARRRADAVAGDERAALAHAADLEREPLAGGRLEDVGHRRHAGERQGARRAPPRLQRRLGLAEGGDELLDGRRAVRGLAAAHCLRDAVGDFEVADGNGLGLGHGGHGRRKDGAVCGVLPGDRDGRAVQVLP